MRKSHLQTEYNTDPFIGENNQYHYFYKIVNNINNKYYLGIHSTANLNDRYPGSGKALANAYKKYGVANFTKYILKFFKTREELSIYENQCVTQDILSDENCYNIIPGGAGQMIGYAAMADSEGNNHFIKVTDERYLSGEYRHPTKDRIHINNGNKTKLVYEKDLQKWFDKGWVIGQVHKSCLGKILIYNPIEDRELFIYEEELSMYLNSGWERRGKSRNKGQESFCKGFNWINNGNICKRVSDNELQNYLDDGWQKGPIQRFTTGYIRITKNGVTKNIPPEHDIQPYLDDGWVLGSHNKKMADNRWVNKDGITKCIHKSELDEYLNNGWMRGSNRIVRPNLGKIAVYKDDKTIMIEVSELDEYLNNGWMRGNPKTGGDQCGGKICITKNGINKKVSPDKLGKYLTDGWKKGIEWKEKVARTRVHLDGVEKLIKTSELQQYLTDGWKKGRKPTK